MECSVVIHQAVEQAPCQLKWLCVSGASLLRRCDLLPCLSRGVLPRLSPVRRSPLLSSTPLPPFSSPLSAQIDCPRNWLMTLAIFWQPFSAVL